jgi:hypothetical protein
MYVDESGDTGLDGSPTDHFVLAGFVVHEADWNSYLERLVAYRRRMGAAFGLPLRAELHSSRLLTRPGSLVGIAKNDRLTIIRAFAKEVATLDRARCICVHVDKRGKGSDYDVFEHAWRALIQRFSNTLVCGNFPRGPGPAEKGMLFPDDTDQVKLKRLVRRMRRYNPIPNQARFGGGFRDLPIDRVIEYPSFRDSAESYFVQVADLIAFLLYQEIAPSAYMRRTGGKSYFERLAPILLTQASSSDPRGIVRLQRGKEKGACGPPGESVVQIMAEVQIPQPFYHVKPSSDRVSVIPVVTGTALVRRQRRSGRGSGRWVPTHLARSEPWS